MPVALLDHCLARAARQYLQSFRGRIVVALTLIAAVLLLQLFMILIPYQREQRILEKIQALQGKAEFEDTEQSWIPQEIQARIRFIPRIKRVSIQGDTSNVSARSELLSELRSLSRLETLDLGSARDDPTSFAISPQYKSCRRRSRNAVRPGQPSCSTA